MTKKLEPTKAQLEAMANALLRKAPVYTKHVCPDLVAVLIEAANKVADGAEVGTVVEDPKGCWIAVRVLDYGSGPFRSPEALGRKWCLHLIRPTDGYRPELVEVDTWPVRFRPSDLSEGSSLNDGLAEYARGESVSSDWVTSPMTRTQAREFYDAIARRLYPDDTELHKRIAELGTTE